MSDKTTLRESLSIAGNSSDLTVSLDRRGDADVLIAAGLSLHQIGRYLDQLVSEWDACAPPRRLSKSDIERVAEELPRLEVEKNGKRVLVLDIRSANARAQIWANQGRRQVLGRLKTLPKIMDPQKGLLAWVVGRGIDEPSMVLLDVLGWYLDRQCPVCHGTKWEMAPGTNRHSGKACHVCRGVGERDLPHGRNGRLILEQLAIAADKARSNTREVLRMMREIKHAAAGRELQPLA